MNLLLAFLMFVVLANGAQAQNNLFVNPSLETWSNGTSPNVPPDGWLDCSVAGVGVDCVPLSCTASPASGSDGAYYARAVGGEAMAQTIATIVGASYTIEFDHCGVEGCFGSAPNSAWSIQVGGVEVLVTPNNEDTLWVTSSVSFVAVSAATEICFMRDLSAIGQGGIDNLRVHADVQIGIGEDRVGADPIVIADPITGAFLVDLGSGSRNVNISLADLSGRTIQTRMTNGTRYVTIGSGVPVGIYFLVMEMGTKRTVRRLVKE